MTKNLSIHITAPMIPWEALYRATRALGCVRLTSYYGIKVRTFTSKDYTYENFFVIRTQSRISTSFTVKILKIYLTKFISKEKSGGYSVYCYQLQNSVNRMRPCFLNKYIQSSNRLKVWSFVRYA